MKFVIYRTVGFDVIQIFFNESDRFIERYIKDVIIGGGKYYMLWNVDFGPEYFKNVVSKG
jgi:hypothetical protein